MMREIPLKEVSVGDRIKVEEDGKEYTGILMPTHRFSADDIMVLKLDNGYNIGLRVRSDKEVKVLESKGEIGEEEVDLPPIKDHHPMISILATGGTIASYVDYHTGAVHPAQTAEEMIYSNPELAERCSPSVKVLFSKLSEDIEPQDWIEIADAVIKEFEAGAEGVVVAHGTDTMGYTSAALSFLLEDLPGPVVLVGSQRSSDRPSSDSNLNLLSAVEVAKADVSGVFVVMHDDLDDGWCAIHKGTKVRKMHTSRRDAFLTINGDPVGWVDPITEDIEIEGKAPDPDKKPRMKGGINPNVSLIYAHPGMDEDILKREKDGIVMMGTGLGHLPSPVISSVDDHVKDGKIVVITTQCIHGTVNCNIYSSGRKLLDAGAISCEDMLPETALVKLMWALTLEEDTASVMQKNIRGEISERRVR